VSGKGVPAAIVMAMAHAAFPLRACGPARPSRNGCCAPRSAASTTTSSRLEMFATAFLVPLRRATRTLRYVNAGHAPAILPAPRRPQPAARRRRAAGRHAGQLEQPGPRPALAAGDLLVVATDGFTDSTAPDGTYYGVDRLADAIARVAQRDAHVIVNALLEDVDAFRQGRRPPTTRRPRAQGAGGRAMIEGDAADEHHADAPLGSPGSPGGRILVVDDDPVTRRVLSSMLERAHYDVMASTDGREAWTELAAARIDLVITDREMPAMNGLELLRAVRQSPRHGGVPVVMLTGTTLETPATRPTPRAPAPSSPSR
jgi:CheY-like chemotaxis protein